MTFTTSFFANRWNGMPTFKELFEMVREDHAFAFGKFGFSCLPGGICFLPEDAQRTVSPGMYLLDRGGRRKHRDKKKPLRRDRCYCVNSDWPYHAFFHEM